MPIPGLKSLDDTDIEDIDQYVDTRKIHGKKLVWESVFLGDLDKLLVLNILAGILH